MSRAALAHMHASRAHKVCRDQSLCMSPLMATKQDMEDDLLVAHSL
jgi:hypothetical protein